MNNRKATKIGVGFGLFSMAFMVAGSLLAGARLTVAIIRGVEGAAMFGLLAWLLCSALGGGSFTKDKVADKPRKSAE